MKNIYGLFCWDLLSHLVFVIEIFIESIHIYYLSKITANLTYKMNQAFPGFKKLSNSTIGHPLSDENVCHEFAPPIQLTLQLNNGYQKKKALHVVRLLAESQWSLFSIYFLYYYKVKKKITKTPHMGLEFVKSLGIFIISRVFVT